jgi:hypothetical protein
VALAVPAGAVCALAGAARAPAAARTPAPATAAAANILALRLLLETDTNQCYNPLVTAGAAWPEGGVNGNRLVAIAGLWI